ncbi:hypothetical protein DERF_009793 [Dermatophagoides farinae]|uniref:Uncharacterized protein n=1 Tax=Dermatophagoides farinae TaxID=6954 RepID=A0A922HUQ9_DERFA|nr:hypothetical protein DERF_009793 [Dermatophagoides farinae]
MPPSNNNGFICLSSDGNLYGWFEFRIIITLIPKPLDRDGNVYACGSALYGKLGLGEDFIQQCNSNDKSISDFKQIPSTIFNGERVIKIDCGDFCSMAITEMGRLYCWGQGGYRLITKGPYAECTRFTSISTGAQMAAMIGTIIIDDNVNEDDDSLMESK